MPTRTAAAGAGEDAPETNEHRSQRERRPTRRAIAAVGAEAQSEATGAEFESESAGPTRQRGRSRARATNTVKTVVLDLEPVVMGSGANTSNNHDDDDDDDEIHDVVMLDSEVQPQHDAQAESESHSEPQTGNEPEAQKQSEVMATPRRRGRPARSKDGISGTPTKTRPSILKTPVKGAGMRPAAFTPGRAADRSARKKSARALIGRAMHDGASDDEQAGDHLAREIYESSDDAEDADNHDDDDDDDGDGDGDGTADAADEVATPSKRPRGRQAGQAKRRKKARSPTPPRDLPRHEMYFLHNKPGRPKTSDNTLSSLSLLTHDEYFSIARTHRDRHAADIEFLESLHAESFPQWAFELSQAFSVCLYGLGSKRALLHKFARAVHARSKAASSTSTADNTTTNKIVMVNGYAHTTTLRGILSVVGAAVSPHRIPVGQPSAMAASILSHLTSDANTGSTAGTPTPTLTLTLAINSIDAPPLRKLASQAILAQLASHPRIHLVCTADTPDFPLLWDMGLRSAFNFVFHDCTTFARFSAEIDVVDQVHELLGRQTQRANAREGVAFVLRSLTENAKNLFRLLVGEVLVAMEDDDGGGGGGGGGGGSGEDGVGLEYRMVYNKAVEEFICSSEMAFRTLLKEFHDHQMITSRKDALGTELLSLPFRKEDLEAILEDLSL